VSLVGVSAAGSPGETQLFRAMNVQQLIAWVKATPGKHSYAHCRALGNGRAYLAGEMLKQAFGARPGGSVVQTAGGPRHYVRPFGGPTRPILYTSISNRRRTRPSRAPWRRARRDRGATVPPALRMSRRSRKPRAPRFRNPTSSSGVPRSGRNGGQGHHRTPEIAKIVGIVALPDVARGAWRRLGVRADRQHTKGIRRPDHMGGSTNGRGSFGRPPISRRS